MIGIPVRLKTAATLALLGLLALLAGIGQLTFWAPAETVTVSTPGDMKAAPLTVIDEKLIALHDGPMKVSIKGEGNFLVATGRPDDVDAWVGKTAHNTVTGVTEDQTSLQVAASEGEATAPAPAGSDLWVTVENGSGELDYTWNPPAGGDWSLLLASDGTKAAPSSISMTFPNKATMPWALPLIVLGMLVILAGLAFPFLARLINERRGKGKGPDNETPDGGTPPNWFGPESAGTAAEEGPGSRRGRAAGSNGQALRVSLAAGLAAVLVAGSAAGAQATTTPAPSPGTAQASSLAAAEEAPAVPVLLDAQLKRVLEQVASAVAAGDAARDAAKLAPRVDQMELQVRTQNYKIRSSVSAYEARMPVQAGKLLSSVVTTQRSWPRTVLAVTQGEGNVVPQVLTLTQASPRENYKLTASAPLQPGTTFPSIPLDGTASVDPAGKDGLAYSGTEALAALADRLTNAESAFKDKLVETGSSPYIAGALAYQADTITAGTSATFKVTHTPVPALTSVLRTSDGGALVIGRLDFALDGTPKASGDKLLLDDDSAVFAGGKETTTGMVLTFAESVAVYIPPAGSTEPMKLVAATRGLVGASFK
ncbi:hypothetical protein [Arthrobacter cavernae]|uniref:DUF8094 domain-containing protein n=1 Tax=Arthrobacter cavernae TaxID=2817681 RepID=A0A939KIS4_9MICC|nr:hypothetical protein [Arthrobacter cavernae]MBO1266939.1 hypothetical protein [Arthrobacter cavernae]